MGNKTTISIGIPAYNEEANIGNLLKSILSQNFGDYILEKIIVFSDCSNDRTVEIARGFGDDRIMVIDNRDRVGQAGGQNEVFKIADSDIVVLLNVDIVLGSNDFLSGIVAPFKNNPKLGLVSPRLVPAEAKNLFEKIINFSVSYKKYVFKRFNSSNNIYLCCGAARAFSKVLYKKLVWPISTSEDGYSYLFCIKQGLTFSYLDKPFVIYKSPDNFKDHLKQSTRIIGGSNFVYKYFDKKLIDQSYKIPLKDVIIGAAVYGLKNPFYFLAYTLITAYSKIKSYFTANDANFWSASTSSKKINS